MELTQEYLKSILEYDEHTGNFRWKFRKELDNAWNARHAGCLAGGKSNGYISIRIDGKPYYAHQLAFLYKKGYIPENIDHKDINPTNNVWDNLRESTESQNNANKSKYSNNTSGYKNVSWNKRANKWQVSITKDRKTIYGGIFSDLKEAVETANELRFEYFGEFAIYEGFRG
ncbi:homing endonuclease [Salmonella phage vaffelhjerte]|uniref:Homing endonuclease n=1 Tax=Salmonella phage vaffelhjerte TaxID=2713325 RepID=A0A6G8REC9_9CAUD|nr:homing endonuclease [Salmonella phage vaffelhjerte]HCH9411448.1 HNH endonuclease [Salmonella enterica]